MWNPINFKQHLKPGSLIKLDQTCVFEKLLIVLNIKIVSGTFAEVLCLASNNKIENHIIYENIYLVLIE